MVEVFPVEPDRWIAVIGAPAGEFSTETRTPAGVEQEVRQSISAVLGWADPDVVLVDDLGRPWSPRRANEQMARLEVEWRPERRTLLRRLLRRRVPHLADCPACGHDWREHLAGEGVCSECVYELEHAEPQAPEVPCRLLPPPPPRP